MSSVIEAKATGQDPLEGQFSTIRDLLYEIAGISMNDTKRELVHSRLTRRIHKLGGDSITEYVRYVQTPEGRDELTEMVDLLTTNKTSFFRELPHFEYLEGLLAARGRSTRPFTMWSAGCSSGEEPYSYAMMLVEHARLTRSSSARILATDLSARVLARARHGDYEPLQVKPVPATLAQRYLSSLDADTVAVSQDLKRIVRFGRLNLMGPWPMSGPFDLISCRNVMIYFDRSTRETLVQRFTELLAPGGHLFVGHSESLNTLQHELQYIQPAVYRRAP